MLALSTRMLDLAVSIVYVLIFTDYSESLIEISLHFECNGKWNQEGWLQTKKFNKIEFSEDDK